MFATAEIIGLISVAISGFLIAVHYKLDILGIAISSFLTAFGGGIIRDVIVDKTPFIFTHDIPVMIVVATFTIAIIFKLHKIKNLEGRTVFVISDTVGLVSFAISGSLVAIQNDLNFFGTTIIAFITAVGGGTMRDILINRVPSILDSEVYATIALVIGMVIFILNSLNAVSFISLAIIFIFGILLRLLAYHKNWHLPKLS